MVSKNQIKRITGLHQKKYRQQERLFIAEGAKVISELLESDIELDHLFELEPLFPNVPPSRKTMATEADLRKMSALSTPNNCLAVFRIPQDRGISKSGLIVALDDIRDPGNLGTILRLCDWFGVEQVVCSRETADLYNPKVVQATMGSLSRVRVSYVDLAAFLSDATLPVYATFMDGASLYAETLPADAIIVMGNEANGISPAVEKAAGKRISIPRFGSVQKTESLNVATATAIVLSEFRRLH